MAMPSVGLLKYGAVEFNELHHSKLVATPVYDGADRNVAYIRWELTVEATITASQAENWTTDGQMMTLREALLLPGQRLIFDNKGAGRIDTSGNPPAEGGYPARKDVAWGPKPQLLDWMTLGQRAAATVTWKVTFCLPQNRNAQDKDAVMAFTFDTQVAINEHGYSTITYHGSLEIPMTWWGKKVPDRADLYRKVPPLLNWFKRSEATFHQSADSRKLTITVTDTEMPVILPMGCTLCDIDYSVRTSRDHNAFQNWTHTLAGDIQTIPQVGRPTAWQRFLAILIAKKNHLERIFVQGQKKGQLLLMKFEMSESMFGPGKTHFDVSWQLQGISLRDIMTRSGMWIPSPTEPGEWKLSVTTGNGGSGPYHPRGNANIFMSGDETLIDLGNDA